MQARTLRYHANVSRQFRDSSRRFGELICKPIVNSSHPSEIGALTTVLIYTRVDQKIIRLVLQLRSENP